VSGETDRDEYADAREFFGFSASEAVRCLPEGVECSNAKVAETAMVLCHREARDKQRYARAEGFDAGVKWAASICGDSEGYCDEWCRKRIMERSAAERGEAQRTAHPEGGDLRSLGDREGGAQGITPTTTIAEPSVVSPTSGGTSGKPGTITPESDG
jgi:hypothetical protein